MAALLKIDAELAGYSKLEESIQDQIQKVSQELDALSDKEAKYEQLKRNVSVASASAEIFGKRTLEEVSANISIARISSIRIVQPGTKPTEPVFPKLWIMLAVGVIGGTLLGLGTTLAHHKYLKYASAHDQEAAGTSDSALTTNRIQMHGPVEAKASQGGQNRPVLRALLNEVADRN
jgi:hypothetical protein